MQAIIGAVVSSLMAQVPVEKGGKNKKLSKTIVGAHATGGAGLVAILPGVAAGDPTAIGLLVVMAVGWATTLWGRYQAG